MKPYNDPIRYYFKWYCPDCGQLRKIIMEDRWGQIARREECRWCVPLHGSELMQRLQAECHAKVEIVNPVKDRYGIHVNGKRVVAQLVRGSVI